MGVGDPSSLLDTEVDVALEIIVLRAMEPQNIACRGHI